jgi:hypothetical protein
VGGRGGDGIRRRSGGRGGEARGPDPDARRATGDGRSGMLQCVRVIAGHMGLAGPPANTHRAWQAYLLEPARTSQASAGARVANSRRRASRVGRFSCACLHP